MSPAPKRKSEFKDPAVVEHSSAKKPILRRVHSNVIEVLSKMLAVQGQIIKQLMDDACDRKVLEATAEMDCSEALHLHLAKVILPEGEKKMLRLMYQPTDTGMKLFQGIGRPISQLFYNGEAYLTDNEGDIHDIPKYLDDIDENGYQAVQLECAYSKNDDGDDFKNLVPDRARIIIIPRHYIHKACFELGASGDLLSGGILGKLSERLSSHIVNRLNLTEENEQKLIQSLITQTGVYAKGVLN